MTDDQKLKEAQKIHDSLMKGFPGVAKAIEVAQAKATALGYTETILGRRRHHPNMQLPRFEFVPMDGYMNPDIDPLDPESLKNKEQIPKRIIDALTKEFNSYKWYSKIVKRTKELAEQKIKVINNSYKIEEASRQCFNCVDKDTEILTNNGWKRYDEVKIGDEILSYSVERNTLEDDIVTAVHIYDEPAEGIQFRFGLFNTVSTLNHKWVVIDENNSERTFATSEEIYHSDWNRFSIIQSSDNCFSDWEISDEELADLGTALLENTAKDKYSKHIDATTNALSFSFVSKLSQRQSRILLNKLTGFSPETKIRWYYCDTLAELDIFQYLAFRAGLCSQGCGPTAKLYDISDSAETRKQAYVVYVLNRQTVQVAPRDILEEFKIRDKVTIESGTWCVTTNNHTWIARRFGYVFITGNSVIQGSAADVTKMAMLKLEHDPEWLEITGRLVNAIHDELLCEVPLENAERGAEVLTRCMCSAGDFLPFPLSCDAEIAYRWYGLSVEDIAEREKPESLDWDNLSESNIEWVQCMLIENEYLLPVFKEEDGSKPKGVRAQGVNGKVTDELKEYVQDYMNRYNLKTDKEFIDHIEAKVIRGVY